MPRLAVPNLVTLNWSGTHAKPNQSRPSHEKTQPMKVNFTIDCTPEEARAFFGLPDLSSVHQVYLDKLKSTITEGVTSADFEKMTRTWMPGLTDGFEQWQKLLMAAIPKPPQ
jgi:hypothetical protein